MGKTMDLLGSYMSGGKTYGPGSSVTLPESERAQAKIQAAEEVERRRLQEQLQNELAVLPAGHPYQRFFGVSGSQPPAYEGQPTPVSPIAGANFTDAALAARLQSQAVDESAGSLASDDGDDSDEDEDEDDSNPQSSTSPRARAVSSGSVRARPSSAAPAGTNSSPTDPT